MDTTLNERRLAEALRKEQAEAERKEKEIAGRVRRTVEDAGRLRNANPVTSIFLAAEHRRAIKEGDFSVFFLAFSLALAQDGLLDLVAAIPIFGALVVAVPSAGITVYLFVFLWGRGTMKFRAGKGFLKFLIRIGLLTANWIPIVNLFPLVTFCVWWAYRDAKKEREKALAAERKAANELEKDEEGWYMRA